MKSTVKMIPKDTGNGDLDHILASWLNGLNKHP